MNTEFPILKELNQRKSVRAFLPKEIESEKLDALWAAAQWAPSCSNKQDWHYYALIGPARAKLAGVLAPGNLWALKAPLVLCVTHDTATEIKAESRAYGMYDTALSVMSLVVEAEHQGLRSRQMAGFAEEAFRTALAVPANEAPAIVIAIGYEDEKMEGLDPELHKREAHTRERKPVSGTVRIIHENK